MNISEFNLGDTLYLVNHRIQFMGQDEYKTDADGTEWKKVKPKGRVWEIKKGKLVGKFHPTYTLDLAPGISKSDINIDWSEEDQFYLQFDNIFSRIYAYYEDLDKVFKTEEDAQNYINDMGKDGEDN